TSIVLPEHADDLLLRITALAHGPSSFRWTLPFNGRNSRGWVKRRGRILRRSPGKERALIHDFIVVLPDGYETGSDYAKRLIKSELGRVAEFSSLSENRSEAYHTLAPVLRAYDLEHMV
ncbi:hypothetical protein ACFPB0_06735, partial [Glycocaulis abyssi]